MIVFISLAAAVTGWAVLALAPRSDALVADRISALGPPGPRRKTGLVPAKRLLAGVGKSVPGDLESIARALAAGGLAGTDPSLVKGAQALLAALGTLLSVRAGWLAVMVAPAAAAAGWRIPLVMLKRRAQERRRQIAEDLPDVVDLLAVCTQAGLNVALSLKRVAESTDGLLGEELFKVVTRTDLGEPRRAALQDFASSTGLQDAEALVAALTSAEAFGSEVSESLSSLSHEMRQRRRRSVEEQARRAPVKILFPLVFVILPAFLLLTVVPLLLGTLDTLSFF